MLFCWCEKRDLNPYGVTTRPSNVRVCQFRHSRVCYRSNGNIYIIHFFSKMSIPFLNFFEKFYYFFAHIFTRCFYVKSIVNFTVPCSRKYLSKTPFAPFFYACLYMRKPLLLLSQIQNILQTPQGIPKDKYPKCFPQNQTSPPC